MHSTISGGRKPSHGRRMPRRTPKAFGSTGWKRSIPVNRRSSGTGAKRINLKGKAQDKDIANGHQASVFRPGLVKIKTKTSHSLA